MVVSLIGPLIGGGLSLLGGKKASDAASQATDQQVAAQRESLAFQKQFLAQNRADLSAAVDAGLIDLASAFGIATDGGPGGAAGGGTQAQLSQAQSNLAALEQQARDTPQPFGVRNIDDILASPVAGQLGGLMGQIRDARAEVTRLEQGIQAGQAQGQGFNIPQERTAFGQLEPFGNLDAFNQALELINRGAGPLLPHEERAFGRGVESLQAGFSRTSGGGVSSRALERAQQFGSDFERSRVTDRLNQLLPLINVSTQGRANLANLATGFGQQTADLRLRGALGSAQLGSAATPGITASFGNIGQAQAQGTLAQADIFGKTLNEIVSGTTGLQNQLGGLFSSRQPTPVPFGSQQGQNLFGPQFT